MKENVSKGRWQMTLKAKDKKVGEFQALEERKRMRQVLECQRTNVREC